MFLICNKAVIPVTCHQVVNLNTVSNFEGSGLYSSVSPYAMIILLSFGVSLLSHWKLHVYYYPYWCEPFLEYASFSFSRISFLSMVLLSLPVCVSRFLGILSGGLEPVILRSTAVQANNVLSLFMSVLLSEKFLYCIGVSLFMLSWRHFRGVGVAMR